MSRARRRIDPISPAMLFLYFAIQEFALPYAYATSTESWRRHPGPGAWVLPEYMHLAGLALAAFAICWYAGYMLGPRFRGEPAPLLEEPRQAVAHPAAPLVVFGFAAALFLFVSLTHPASDYTLRAELAKGPWGKILFLTINLLFAAYWLSGLALMRRNPHSLANLLLLGLLAVVMIWLMWPLGGRERALISVLYATVLWHYFVRPLNLASFYGILLAGMSVALAVGFMQDLAKYGEVQLLEKIFGVAYGREFDVVYNFAAALQAVQEGWAYVTSGRSLLADVAGDLGVGTPWLDTRETFMAEVMRLRVKLVGYPVGQPGEFFLAMGWVGLGLGGLLMGFLARGWYEFALVRGSFGSLSAPIYITLTLTSGLASPQKYFFQNLVQGCVGVASLLLLATLLCGYRLRTYPPRILAQ